MRDQRDPTADRLRRLLQGNPAVTLDWDGFMPSELDPAERDGVDRLIELAEEGKRLVLAGASRASAAEAAALDADLQELGTRIGTQLRALNRTGVFVAADRGSEAIWSEDPSTGNHFPTVVEVLKLKVHKLAAAA